MRLSPVFSRRVQPTVPVLRAGGKARPDAIPDRPGPQSSSHRFAALRGFYPNVKAAEWRLEVAGQRVQIIKRDARRGGMLEFGTEIVVAPMPP